MSVLCPPLCTSVHQWLPPAMSICLDPGTHPWLASMDTSLSMRVKVLMCPLEDGYMYNNTLSEWGIQASYLSCLLAVGILIP